MEAPFGDDAKPILASIIHWNQKGCVGSHPQPFVWHTWLYHYGRNWQVAGEGEYTLKVNIKALDFPGHDEKNGERYGDDVNVEFEGVQINTGQK